MIAAMMKGEEMSECLEHAKAPLVLYNAYLGRLGTR